MFVQAKVNASFLVNFQCKECNVVRVLFPLFPGRFFGIILLATAIWACPALNTAAVADSRDPAWAAPMAVEGLPNLHKVTDKLYRSAQPSAEGMRNAEKLGIKTVLNLRGLHSDADLAEGTSLKLARIKINTWAMDEDDILEGLRIILQADGPVLVHCQHGADRTGTLMAAYRMVVQGWPREAAIKEMLEGDYGYHAVWGNLITLLENMDITAMRGHLGLKSGTSKDTPLQPGKAPAEY